METAPSALPMSASTTFHLRPCHPWRASPRRAALDARACSAERKRSHGAILLDLLKLSPATVTVLSASLARAEPRRRPAKLASPEEIRQWSSARLPAVDERIPYTEVLGLMREGRIKHIVRPPKKFSFSSTVLLVLQDSRVVRTTLPAPYRDAEFWTSWESLRMGDLCLNAYTPTVMRPRVELPPYIRSALSFLTDQSKEFASSRIQQVEDVLWSPELKVEKSETLLALEKMRREVEAVRREAAAKDKLEREMKKKEEKERRRMEKRQRILAERARKDLVIKEKLTKIKTGNVGDKWYAFADNIDFENTLGFVIFFVFYWLVVRNYKKQKEDYEERQKLQKFEREETERMTRAENDALLHESNDPNSPMNFAKKFMRSGAKVRRVHGRQLLRDADESQIVTFADCAGLGKLRLELEEVVKFFTHGEVYRRRGVKIPGGILLSGPPGVGKTLLAKAVAGEARVNFFSMSASQFVEIYVGVGASRVRALYEEAKENAPSVVFIDELDAVGRERGLIKGSGGQERDATLNQLLVCLDGFEGKGNVITIAATNRPDVLDPALVRPGRFDRKIFIPKPGFIGRAEILKVHARKKRMAGDVDYEAVASATDGMTGAELANIVEIAAISIMRDGRSEITTDDLLQASQAEEIGFLTRKERDLATWKRFALNEASMAVVALNFPELKSVEFITISPRAGRELGYVRLKTDGMKLRQGVASRRFLLDYITVQLAPRAAEEIWYGEDKLSTIWAETANNARVAARAFVLGGLSEAHYGISHFWIEERFKEIDLEAVTILHTCYAHAKEILHRNRVLMDAVVDGLVQNKNLSKQEFFQLVNEHAQLEVFPANITDIRMDKLVKFREMNMKGFGSSLR